MRGREERWRFERRKGLIAEELTAAARDLHEAHPDDIVTIAVGSSSHAMHRVVGSVAVSLARHSAVPLVIVPYSLASPYGGGGPGAGRRGVSGCLSWLE